MRKLKCGNGYTPANEYFNSADVQEALGVPLNFTSISWILAANFGLALPIPPYNKLPLSKQTGDYVRQAGLPKIEYLLANNVKAAFVHGDIDYMCPSTGAETTALAADWSGQAAFAAAGYERLQGSTEQGTDHGALVKQSGRLSFSRVLQGGHGVSAYAPSTVGKIFERTIMGLDVVTGEQEAAAGYSSKGPTDSLGFRQPLPQDLPGTCVVNGRFLKHNV